MGKKVETKALTAKDRDKQRLADGKKTAVKKQVKTQRKIKKTTIQTLPYERVLSDYVMLLKTGLKIDKETVNLYSKTYHVPDINYSSGTRAEQTEMLLQYMDLLNGFDSNASFQMTVHNAKINKKEFEKRVLLKAQDDGLQESRDEFNLILHDKLMLGQNGIQSKLYITVTIAAVDFETANGRFLNYEAHMTSCLKKLQTELIPLKANERIRLLIDIFRDVDMEFWPVSRAEFARGAEKLYCCPDYFDFKRDYFMFNDKFARCLYFSRLPQSVGDDLFKSIIETNQSLIITKNVEFVEPAEAVKLVRRQLTNMKTEQINKTKKVAEAAKGGAFIDPIQGSALEESMIHAQELLSDLQGRNQKMTLCQFIIMLTADSFEELQANTEAIKIILRKKQIVTMDAHFRQEQAMSSCLPLGNSFSSDKEKNLQVRRTLSSESTAVFVPFNARELIHEGGLYYGLNQMTHNIILFDRRKLNNPNGFILGVPGSGKSFAAKVEMIYSILGTNDEILIVDPEREYTALAELFGGEIIYISENSKTHINPLDLTENPDKTDTEYDPVKAKYDFLLSFFSTILGNKELQPNQKTIIDVVMYSVYRKHEKPTLKEYYAELEAYEKESEGENKRTAAYLKQALHLYVHGSMNVFSNPSNINIQKRIVVYDIKDLGKNLQTLGMMIVLENLWDRVAKNRYRGLGTRIYIDEMYLLFKSEQSANFFYELYKRARKWGGVPTGITQNVEDLLRSEMARAMLSNTEFVLMLSQNATDREKLSDLLKISPETMSYVTNSGSGRGLLFAGKFGAVPFVNQFPTDSNIYKKISTRFGEKADEKKLSGSEV